MIQLDLSDHRPLYEQIKDKIKELIMKGILEQDTRIPSVRELAQQLTINPNTIQRAYKDLENDGYIYSVRAKGSFVSPVSHIRDSANRTDFCEAFRDAVREAKFLGMEKEALITEINTIYKE